jgi:hypothetical protein
MTIAGIGAILFAYTIFIRPFITETKLNDTRTDNLYWFVGSLLLTLFGLVFGI